jgi:uncharacterized protein (DUF2384 family)
MGNPREVEGVVNVLGGTKVVGKSVRSPEDLAERVRKGLPFAALVTADESDRLYRLARVIAHANRVFEDPDESADWIHAPNTSLGKQQPLTLLDTDIGVQQVDQVLGRIEHGIVG